MKKVNIEVAPWHNIKNEITAIALGPIDATRDCWAMNGCPEDEAAPPYCLEIGTVNKTEILLCQYCKSIDKDYVCNCSEGRKTTSKWRERWTTL